MYIFEEILFLYLLVNSRLYIQKNRFIIISIKQYKKYKKYKIFNKAGHWFARGDHANLALVK